MKCTLIVCVSYGLLLVVLASTSGGTDFCSWTDLVCQRNEFRCLNGEKCISRRMYCNGYDDCGDNSDERYCSTTSCPEEYYKRCTSYSSKCIPKEWYCDGNYDCPDSSDEYNCKTRIFTRPEKMPISEESWMAIQKVKQWVSKQRNEQFLPAEKWGSHVDRLALTLYHTTHKFNTSQPSDTEMTNELTIRLLSRLLSTKLEDFSSTELASYVNSFLVTCINPRNFYGYDIIEELRSRADRENYTNPYVFLALCNAGENITEADKKKLMDTFENKHRTFWTGMQAVVVMALACANKQAENAVDEEKLRLLTLELKQQQYMNGTVVDLPTTALVMQALISSKSEKDPDNFDEMKAFRELLRSQKPDGSFGDPMSTFLVTPVLTCRSLIDVKSDHCHFESRDEISALENLSKKSGTKIRIEYSIWIGDSIDLERNLVLRVPEKTSLYGVMEIAAGVDNRFEFEYSVKNSKPYIRGISGMRDDPLTGKYWFLYTIQNDEPVLSTESPADVMPEEGDHFVLWYRSGSWIHLKKEDMSQRKYDMKEDMTDENFMDSKNGSIANTSQL